MYYFLNVLTNVPWNRCINSWFSINEEARIVRGSFVENLEFIVYVTSRGNHEKNNTYHLTCKNTETETDIILSFVFSNCIHIVYFYYYFLTFFIVLKYIFLDNIWATISGILLIIIESCKMI